MLSTLLLVALAQPPRVAVIDVSAPDAIYEDVSRGLAEALVQALVDQGIEAVRVDERELPDEGCRVGPCLGVVAKSQKAHVIVILDATEKPKDKTTALVNVAAMAGRNGQPLAGGRYEVKDGQKKKPKGFTAFVEAIQKVADKFREAVDAGAGSSVKDAGPAAPGTPAP